MVWQDAIKRLGHIDRRLCGHEARRVLSRRPQVTTPLKSNGIGCSCNIRAK